MTPHEAVEIIIGLVSRNVVFEPGAEVSYRQALVVIKGALKWKYYIVHDDLEVTVTNDPDDVATCEATGDYVIINVHEGEYTSPFLEVPADESGPTES